MPVVDASVVVDWVAPSADPELPAVALLERLALDDAELVAPRLLLEEVSNALLTGIRRGRWSGAAADAGHALLRRLPVRLVDEPRDIERAWDLARRYDNHPIYDMVYVAVAERRRVQLVTADSALREALVGFDWVVAPEVLSRLSHPRRALWGRVGSPGRPDRDLTPIRAVPMPAGGRCSRTSLIDSGRCRSSAESIRPNAGRRDH